MDEAAFRRLISRQHPGPIARMFRTGLRVASVGYRAVIGCRNALYDSGLIKTHQAIRPVISIGNLTTGGTGKTPIVALTCQLLQACGYSPAIISRGYRSVNGQANDEKLVLALQCPDVPHEQHPNRVAAAEALCRQHSVSAIVMDDGFQHRRLHRDLNVVLIDATNPFGYGFLLPRGLLREPLSALRRADVVLITRADLVDETELTMIERTVLQAAPGLAGRVLRVMFRPTGLLRAAGARSDFTAVAGRPVFLMSGIGNPDAFALTCRKAKLRIAGTRWFPDHHHYTADDVPAVVAEAQQVGAVEIVTTLKDLVKLTAHTDNVFALEIDAVLPIADQHDCFLKLVRSAVSGNVD